jgi:hypothetical protein
VVRSYVDSLKGKLQLHYLPGYAPELNPDELVWNHMKRTGTAKKPLRKGDQLQSRIDADLQAIQRDPGRKTATDRVRGYKMRQARSGPAPKSYASAYA